MRYEIRTSVVLGKFKWPIELALNDRKSLRFRKLLGRAAINDILMVDSAKPYLSGRRMSELYPKAQKNHTDEQALKYSLCDGWGLNLVFDI
jgi:hypothetical protein